MRAWPRSPWRRGPAQRPRRTPATLWPRPGIGATLWPTARASGARVDAQTGQPSRRSELALFLFITVVLFPVLAVMIVGGYGFAVWIFQMFTGPPTG